MRMGYISPRKSRKQQIQVAIYPSDLSNHFPKGTYLRKSDNTVVVVEGTKTKAKKSFSADYLKSVKDDAISRLGKVRLGIKQVSELTSLINQAKSLSSVNEISIPVASGLRFGYQETTLKFDAKVEPEEAKVEEKVTEPLVEKDVSEQKETES